MTLHNRSSRSSSLSTANFLEDDCTSRSIEATYSDYEHWRSDNRRHLLNDSLLPISTDEGPESHGEQAETVSKTLLNRRGRNQESALQNLTDPVQKSYTDHEKAVQPEMISHHEHQLMADVEEIYATLVKMEKECISFHKSQLVSEAELSDSQWQRHIIMHESLLNRYEDVILVFVNSHLTSAGVLLKRFCDSRHILARMWRAGIFLFLEILRQSYPKTVKHIIEFINSAYSTIIRLSESVSVFRDTWNEQLGDLARYRMAMESSDGPDRQLWARRAKDWYNQVAFHVPSEGRIKHHLAVMAHPDSLQQLFYYTTALVSVRPYFKARRELKGLLDSHNGPYFRLDSTVCALLATHGILLSHGSTEDVITLRKDFLSLMRTDIAASDRRGLQFVYIMSSNFASLLEYGALESIIAAELRRNMRKDLTSAYADALSWSASKTADEKGQNDSPMDAPLRILPWFAFEGSSLAFHTLRLLLEQTGDHDVCLGIHISLAFIWCLALHPLAIEQVEQGIPWSAIAQYLNSLLSASIIFPIIEDESFPQLEDIKTQQLPEDFLIQDQMWSRLYYPEGFFEGAPFEHERPHIKEYSMVVVRNHRCLWLAVRISTVSDKFELIWKPRLSANFIRNTVQALDEIHSRERIHGDPTRADRGILRRSQPVESVGKFLVCCACFKITASHSEYSRSSNTYGMSRGAKAFAEAGSSGLDMVVFSRGTDASFLKKGSKTPCNVVLENTIETITELIQRGLTGMQISSSIRHPYLIMKWQRESETWIGGHGLAQI